jgi:hypothetical protein
MPRVSRGSAFFVRPTMRPFRNRYLPLWLHRVACGVLATAVLALLGMSFIGRSDGSWRYFIGLCLIILSVPTGIFFACVAHRFSIVHGLAGDLGYEDLDDKHDDKPSA